MIQPKVKIPMLHFRWINQKYRKTKFIYEHLIIWNTHIHACKHTNMTMLTSSLSDRVDKTDTIDYFVALLRIHHGSW